MNEGDLKIKFIAAITGSIIIHSDIDTDALITDTSLQKELTTFMKRILYRGRLQITSFQWIDAVIFLVEGILTCKLVLFKKCFFFSQENKIIFYTLCVYCQTYTLNALLFVDFVGTRITRNTMLNELQIFFEVLYHQIHYPRKRKFSSIHGNWY